QIQQRALESSSPATAGRVVSPNDVGAILHRRIRRETAPAADPIRPTIILCNCQGQIPGAKLIVEAVDSISSVEADRRHLRRRNPPKQILIERIKVGARIVRKIGAHRVEIVAVFSHTTGGTNRIAVCNMPQSGVIKTIRVTEFVSHDAEIKLTVAP